jgi:4a-hydroxytetrahydrobiopterin dehydratase
MVRLTPSRNPLACSVPTILSESAIKSALGDLAGWAWENDAMVKVFQFESFREAISFMVRVAFEADALDHHPEWTNVYNRVSISLNTHSADGKVTDQDLELARKIESVSWV